MDRLIYPIVKKRILPFLIMTLVIDSVNGEVNGTIGSLRIRLGKLHEFLDCLSNGSEWEGTTTPQPYNDFDHDNTTPPGDPARHEPIQNQDCFSDPELMSDFRIFLLRAEDSDFEIERLTGEIQKLTSSCERMETDKNDEVSGVHSSLTRMTREMEALQHELTLSQAVVGKQGREISRMWKNMELKETELAEMNRTTLAMKQRESSAIRKLKEENKKLSFQLKEKDKELVWVKTAFFKNGDWNSELHLAAGRRDLDAVRRLVKARGVYIDARNRRLETPLITAAATRADKSQYLPVIKHLIEEGADVYAKDVENRTFLHNLVGEDGEIPLTPGQFHDLVVFLVGKNMQKLFNAPTGGTNINPLQAAVSNIEVEHRTLQLLQNNGVKLETVTDAQGNSILFYPLLGKRSTNLLYDIISLGVDRMHLNNQNQSLLHIASQFCYVDGVKYFLGLGLDINALDSLGDTPLHKAVKFGEGDERSLQRTVRVLVDNWANIYIKNDNGRTPLAVVLRRDDVVGKNRREMIHLLKGSQAGRVRSDDESNKDNRLIRNFINKVLV